jgi:phthiocerol/phenolphthiocerol synthesis type-I polyketide synthase C
MQVRTLFPGAETAIVGAACRLPGAGSLAAFWHLLMAGENAVRLRPEGRWSIERFLRPGDPAPGFAYSFAGGYLDHPLDFDPAPFGLSPREARQMDPQQRLLLEVVWEALGDAAIPASSLAGREVGVYVGASMVDYLGTASQDPAVMESHFMTGNALSVLSNRISYVFDFKGPSFTVDSACSSSFVALRQAIEALNAGTIELAVVGGVNLLLSPVPFIGFSQARMLSPTGQSRPFSAEADGYVRSEGAVVLVLRRAADALAGGARVRGMIVGACVNSDGRTSGISLPSLEGQQRLIEDFYAGCGVSPDALAFVEAHGTGTRVGDPIEAAAIGRSLGQRRRMALPIGSVKSNIGHLEAASGLAGLLKAVLALENRVLPPSLFLDKTSPDIDFAALNLAPNATARPLDPAESGTYAGICNYGFGGTNAHVLVRAADAPLAPPRPERRARQLVASAADGASLAAFAGALADAIAGGLDVDAAARTLGHGRELMKHRLALPLGPEAGVKEALRAFAAGMPDVTRAAAGIAVSSACPVVFVFSGNGSQFPAMGQAAYAASARFRVEIAEIDRVFAPLSGWSIAHYLTKAIPDTELRKTSIAQPLIYAIQSALAGCLAEAGIRPEAVLGHSVGEVAAAEAAGILGRADAVRLVALRSAHQERARGLGRMLVVAADGAAVAAHLDAFGGGDIEIAALNSATSTTVSGPAERLDAFAKRCRAARIATIPLDIDYPFHSSALEPLRADMTGDLAFLRPRPGSALFFSTVTGAMMAGEHLDAAYWWRNIRDTVRFRDALIAAADTRERIFIEISPRALLTGAIAETLRDHGRAGVTLASLAQKDGDDPVGLVLARLIAHGAGFDRDTLLGSRPACPAPVPAYAFQRQPHALSGTHEAFNAFGTLDHAAPRHPLLGARMAEGSPEWRSLVDPVLVPYLADHRVDGGVIVPAAGLIDMALAAGRDIFGPGALELVEFDVLRPLAVAPDETREVSTRYAEAGNGIEIWSRRRFAAEAWVLHARGRLALAKTPAPAPLPPPVEGETITDSADALYAEASLAGLDYGPLFRLVTTSTRDAVTVDAQLAEPASDGLGAFADVQVIHPISLDAAFHGLFISRPQRDGERKAHLPVRFSRICVWKPGAVVRRAITVLRQEGERFKTVAITLLDAGGAVVLSVEGAVLRALLLSRATTADRTFRAEQRLITRPAEEASRLAAALARLAPATGLPHEVPAPWLVARAFTVSLAYGVLRRCGDTMPEASRPLIEAARLILEGFGLLADGVIAAEKPLPPPSEILATLIAHFPEANLEIRLAAHALTEAERLIHSGTRLMPTPALRDQIETGGVLTAGALTALREGVLTLATDAGRRLRVLALAPWSAGLMRALLPLAQAGLIELTLTAPDRRAIDAARAQGQIDADTGFLDLTSAAALAGPLPFDLLVAAATGPVGDTTGQIPPALRALMRPDAPVLVAAPGADATLDFLLGLWTGWFDAVDGAETGLSRFPPHERLITTLEAFGAVEVARHATPDGLGALLTGRVPAAETIQADPAAYALVTSGDALGAVLAAQADLLLDADARLGDRIIALAAAGTLPPHLLYAVPESGEDAVEALARSIEVIRGMAMALAEAGSACRLTVLTRGALDEDPAPTSLAGGIRGFLRVAINEMPGVDLRLVDIAGALGAAEAAGWIGPLLGYAGDELELHIGAGGISALRMQRNLLPPEALDAETRAVLRFEQAGRLESFGWVKAERVLPGAGEIEIAVGAVGLNFRDVLVGIGVLDEDLLGAGLTAAALGFECAGTVTRVGEGVTDLRVGDAVMGFAAEAFASHLVAPEAQFFKVPAGVSLEAAATIPVAFGTAWFALVERARLRAGEDVLIHGGAGGVGLAAIQLAKSIGARVIATASSAERRTIARAAGADITYDSRQERFAQTLREEQDGVDVVLNSLAGPAMEASFRLLRPFGRFLELGKRDFLDNTALGLRPFVRNLSYFGVDLDEVLAHERALVATMMAQIAEQFVEGTLKPLPYRVFEAHEVGAAFRLMQASGHVGKIVVRPAKTASRDATALRFSPKAGVYLVVGGTGGLGFASARWLARSGAGTVVLAARRGRLEEGLDMEVERLCAAGTRVLIETLDVTDGAAVRALVARLAREHGPVRGVIHAAVHLDDGLIAHLAPERLRAVLRPKLLGAQNLDNATADQPLDFFVVYSSATTVIGSPGQAAYVAANGWLEGFARERRARGLPALAIGWGAISDVGILARDRNLGRRLRRTTGVVGLTAAEALAHLGRLLALGNAVGPMQFYTQIAPTAAAEKLRLINSAAFTGLGLARRAEEGAAEEDLLAVIAGKSEAEARGMIVLALRREIAHILRMPEAQIDTTRPLGDMGLDSLMALELQLAIERLCGTDIPMVGAGDRRLADIAGVILSTLGRQEGGDASRDGQGLEGETGREAGLIQALSSRHAAGPLSTEEAGGLRQRMSADVEAAPGPAGRDTGIGTDEPGCREAPFDDAAGTGDVDGTPRSQAGRL